MHTGTKMGIFEQRDVKCPLVTVRSDAHVNVTNGRFTPLIVEMRKQNSPFGKIGLFVAFVTFTFSSIAFFKEGHRGNVKNKTARRRGLGGAKCFRCNSPPHLPPRRIVLHTSALASFEEHLS